MINRSDATNTFTFLYDFYDSKRQTEGNVRDCVIREKV